MTMIIIIVISQSKLLQQGIVIATCSCWIYFWQMCGNRL